MEKIDWVQHPPGTFQGPIGEMKVRFDGILKKRPSNKMGIRLKIQQGQKTMVVNPMNNAEKATISGIDVNTDAVFRIFGNGNKNFYRGRVDFNAVNSTSNSRFFTNKIQVQPLPAEPIYLDQGFSGGIYLYFNEDAEDSLLEANGFLTVEAVTT